MFSTEIYYTKKKMFWRSVARKLVLLCAAIVHILYPGKLRLIFQLDTTVR